MARALIGALLLIGTATGLSYVDEGSYTMPMIRIQSPVATGILPAATDEAGLSQLAMSFLAAAFSPAFSAARDRCPAKCNYAGHNPANWTVYHSTQRLAWCNETMLLDFSIHNNLSDPNTDISIRTCTADIDPSSPVAAATRRDVTISCAPAPNEREIQAQFQAASLGTTTRASLTDVLAAAQATLQHLIQVEATCNSTTLFASAGPATLAL